MKIRSSKLIFLLVCLPPAFFYFSGCVTEYNLATKKQETLMYDSEKEVKIGEAVAPKIEEQFDIVTDADINERVERIFRKLVAVCDRKDLVYFIKVLDDDPINAVSLPGGYVYVFRGLIDHVENDDQLAGVIAHEIGHITAKHGVKRMQNAYAAMALQIAAVTSGKNNIAQGTNLALTSLFLEYSQQDEMEADRLSVKYLKKAGYDPKAMPDFLKIMEKEKDKEPLSQHSYWKTHPNLSQRISAVNQEVTGQLEFRDYLNLTGND